MSATASITAMLALFGAALISASSMGEFGWVGPPTAAPTTKAPTTTAATTTAATMTTTAPTTTAAAITTTAATPTTRAPTIPDDGDIDAGTDDAINTVIDSFNNYRAVANAPDLTVSPALTARAKICADLFEDRYIGTDQDHEAYGKMLACKAAEEIGTLEYFCVASSATSSDPNSAARNCLVEWIDNEKPLFNRAEPKYRDETRHYTQIIWKGTTEVGCALSEVMTHGLASGRRSLVCLFNPPGNVIVAFSPSVAFAKNVGLQ